MSAATTMPRWLAFAALIAGNIALALGPWFVRLADSGPISAGFWRLALALPLLALLARQSRQPLSGYGRGLWLAVWAAGLIFALDLGSWHLGIDKTLLANAALFGNSGSLILMVWGFVVLRRLPRGGEAAAVLLALGGAALLMGRSAGLSADRLIGDLLSVLAGLFYAAYILILRRARDNIGHWALLFHSSLAGAPLLLAMAMAMGEPVWPSDWTPLIILTLSSQLIGQGLLVLSLSRFSPLVIGLALLSQPAVAALAGWLVFAERLALADVIGIVAVAAALLVARLAEESPAKTAPETAASGLDNSP